MFFIHFRSPDVANRLFICVIFFCYPLRVIFSYPHFECRLFHFYRFSPILIRNINLRRGKRGDGTLTGIQSKTT